ncbi:hypothetical protein ACWT_5628 [Actinoplanes sp. SE50]|uniref:type VII secretion target n=1 Tax=unclassified Actinoplanes TaxID=2626549 RepID=UPI00023ED0F8|nr:MULTISPECIES: type VII secretion target [unclassified Actinoplanes]AEV86645.1 hypothetical protein ACPL_5758 [Actinoplanes sp. SE50/110]ATO85043.1 hypothetical protein ACWT_5628 [Actinoplanes sp. SE50]SLM02453.1 hypothetical protein ACSP50_5703 [Actinoplanes sp. SE50/110]
MTAGPDGLLVDAGQLRRHAANLRALHDRFAAVRAASGFITHDPHAYGLLCSWLPALLAARHRRQDELVAYVAENLDILAGHLHAAATDYEASDDRSAATIRTAGRLI